MMAASKRGKGFTLAEVLITLGIIGVIAALTIPALNNAKNKVEYTTGFKVATSSLNSATSSMVNDNGGDLTGVYSSGDAVRNAFASKLTVSKNCDGSSFFANCWYPKDDVKSLNGWLHLDHYNDVVDDFRVGGQGLILSNGMLLFFNTTWGFAQDCTNVEGGIGPECLMLWSDINGHKPPNTLGRDIFIYMLTKTGVTPWGSPTNATTYCDPATADSWNGMECAKRITVDNGMNY